MSWPDAGSVSRPLDLSHGIRRPRGRAVGDQWPADGVSIVPLSPYEARRVEALALQTTLSYWVRDVLCAALGIENTRRRYQRTTPRRLTRQRGRPCIGVNLTRSEWEGTVRAAAGRSMARWMRLCVRAALGLRLFWKPEDDAVLRTAWRRADAETLQRLFPGASDRAIKHRANDLGLTGGAPDGYVSLDEAARVAGYSKETTRRILAAADVVPLARHGTGPGRHRYVRVADVTRAVKLWQSREDLVAAAVRVAVPRNTLERWMRAAGYEAPGPRHRWRLAPTDVDAVVAAHRPQQSGRLAA